MAGTQWREDEEFSGDDIDYPAWRRDWRNRGTKLEYEQALAARRSHFLKTLPACVRMRLAAMRAGTPVNRRMIYERDEATCQICRLPLAWEDLAIDHIVPIAYGGRHGPEYVQATHRVCNSRKGARLNYSTALSP